MTGRNNSNIVSLWRKLSNYGRVLLKVMQFRRERKSKKRGRKRSKRR
jgi:hypothetical protein